MSFIAANPNQPNQARPALLYFRVSPDEFTDRYFQWTHYIDLEIWRNDNGLDETITFTTSTFIVTINGLRLQPICDALNSHELQSVWKVTMGDPDKPLVQNITINPRQ
jgi:hypothetical protein